MRSTLVLLCPAVCAAAGFSTFIGDQNPYRVAAITTDAAGNTYLTGSRLLAGFGSVPVLSSPPGVKDVFVTKLDAASHLVFTATVGGKGVDTANAIALDPAGNIWVGGSTTSRNFPLRNALQSQTSPGSTGFLLRFTPDGQLAYSTLLGGVLGPSTVNGVATDASGNVYVTGSTNARDYAEGLSYMTIATTSGAFVLKIAAAGDKILFQTAIIGHAVACGGGSSCFLSTRVTAGVGIAVDSSGNTYVAGNTNTTDIPTTPGALKQQGIGAFVSKLDSAGKTVFLTYLGDANYVITPFANPGNTVAAIAVDASGSVYLAGSTNDPYFPATPGAYQPKFSLPVTDPYPPPFTDAFAAKLRPDGSGMTWATYLGRGGADAAQSLAVDSSGNVWISGTTLSADFPDQSGAPEGFRPEFAAEFNASGSALSYIARYPDGSAAQAVAIGAAGSIVIAGSAGVVSSFTAGAAAAPRLLGITNGAGGTLEGRIAPGEVVSLIGFGLGPSAPLTATPGSDGLYPKTLGGAQVLVNGVPAPLLYVSATQINAVIPFALSAPGAARVQVSFNSTPAPEFRAAAMTTMPGVFEPVIRAPGSPGPAILENGSINGPGNPARAGSIIAIWATGVINPAGEVDGSVSGGARSNAPVAVFFDNGIQAEVVYSGDAPGIVAGVSQINIRVPAQIAGLPESMLYVLAGGRVNDQPVSVWAAGP
jgi:uncharacterized protein (TIGR03437 family)